jgi:hypothetical protein
MKVKGEQRFVFIFSCLFFSDVLCRVNGRFDEGFKGQTQGDAI